MEDMDPISDGHTTIATTYKRWEHKLSNSVCTQEKKKGRGEGNVFASCEDKEVVSHLYSNQRKLELTLTLGKYLKISRP